MRRTAWILTVFLATASAAALAVAPALAAGPADATPSKTTKPDNKKKKSDKNERHAVSTSPNYIGLDPIYTTLLDRDAVAGTLMLGIGLDVSDPSLRDYVVQNLPILRDLYVRTMLAYTSISVRSWRQPDVDEIADILQRATDRKLKKKGARILLAQVAIRLNN
jgi:flagellar basal body-associated protein FliL